jgi:hypothetical protein
LDAQYATKHLIFTEESIDMAHHLIKAGALALVLSGFAAAG